MHRFHFHRNVGRCLDIRHIILIQAVMQRDRRERIQMRRLHGALHFHKKLAEQDRCAEIGMVHTVIVLFRVGSFCAQGVIHALLGNAIYRPQLFHQQIGEHLVRGKELPACHLHRLVQLGEFFYSLIRDEGAVFPFLAADLKIRRHLLIGQFEGVSDIVEQRGKTPVLQEMRTRLTFV